MFKYQKLILFYTVFQGGDFDTTLTSVGDTSEADKDLKRATSKSKDQVVVNAGRSGLKFQQKDTSNMVIVGQEGMNPQSIEGFNPESVNIKTIVSSLKTLVNPEMSNGIQASIGSTKSYVYNLSTIQEEDVHNQSKSPVPPGGIGRRKQSDVYVNQDDAEIPALKITEATYEASAASIGDSTRLMLSDNETGSAGPKNFTYLSVPSSAPSSRDCGSAFSSRNFLHLSEKVGGDFDSTKKSSLKSTNQIDNSLCMQQKSSVRNGGSSSLHTDSWAVGSGDFSSFASPGGDFGLQEEEMFFDSSKLQFVYNLFNLVISQKIKIVFDYI